MDGAYTTFFGSTTGQDTSKYPNFFGTSAATPHAGAIAALVLEAHGGPGSVTPEQMRQILEESAFAHSLTPYYAEGRATKEDQKKPRIDMNGREQEPIFVSIHSASYGRQAANYWI